MKLPRFIRRWAAMLLAANSPEIGGVLHDYANGKWIELHQWNNLKDANLAAEIIASKLRLGKDEILISMIKCGPLRGLFVVHDSSGNFSWTGFWKGIYDPDEAFLEVAKHCRKLADKMGFRRPDYEATDY